MQETERILLSSAGRFGTSRGTGRQTKSPMFSVFGTLGRLLPSVCHTHNRKLPLTHDSFAAIPLPTFSTLNSHNPETLYGWVTGSVIKLSFNCFEKQPHFRKQHHLYPIKTRGLRLTNPTAINTPYPTCLKILSKNTGPPILVGSRNIKLC
jgi:hypothetical protein